MKTSIADLYENVITGNRSEVEAKVKQALSEGIEPQEILSEGLISAMTDVGRRFELGDFFVPEMLIAAAGHASRLAILSPTWSSRGSKQQAGSSLEL